MNYIHLLSVCDKSYVAETLYILKICLITTCILTPIIIIINTSINLFKAVQSGKDEDLKESFKKSIKNIIAGLIVFMIPSIFSYIFTNLIPGEGDSLMSCINDVTIEKVKSLKEKERQERLAEKEAEDRKTKEKADERTAKEKAYNDSLPKEKPTEQNSNVNNGNVTVSNNGVSNSDFNNKLNSMQTPSKSELEAAASKNGISSEYLKIVIGTTEREGYVNDPYLYYGWASAMLNNQVSISQMQGWDPGHSGNSNYYSEANIMNGYNNASANTLKAVYLALTERNTKIIECNGMYKTTPSSYNLIYSSSVYNCSIYERK